MKYAGIRKGIYCSLMILTLILMGPSFVFAQEEGTIFIKNYTPSDYLGHVQNWDIVQDDRGVLYFGNSSGILEYDGVTWRLIDLDNKSIARSFDRDSSGKIYVGGVGEFGYLLTDSSGRMMYHSLMDKVNEEDRGFHDVWFVQCAGDKVYFITNEIIFVLHNDEISKIELDDYLGPAITLNNKTYIHAYNSGLLQIRGDSLVTAPQGDFFRKKTVWLYLPLNDTSMIIGTMNSGLFLFDFSGEHLKNDGKILQEYKTEIDDLLKEETLYSGCILKDGNIALGTLSNGIYIIDPQGKLLRHISKKLRNNMIWYLLQDYNENLWVATNNGISKINIDSPISFWGIGNGLESAVDEIIRSNKVLYLTGFGGIQYISNNEIKNIEELSGQGYCSYDFRLPDSPDQSRLLASTSDFGVVEIHKGKFKEIINLDPWVFYQSVKDPTKLYLGHDVGYYIAEYKDHHWKLLGNIEGITEDIRDIYEDENGEIWLCTYINGIIRIVPSDDILKPKEIIRYRTESGLHSLRDVLFSNFDERLIILSESGILEYDEQADKFIPDSTFGVDYCNGSRTVYIFEKDYSGKIWIAGIMNKKDYIHVLEPNDDGTYSVMETNILNILPPMTVEAIYIDPDNTVWIGGSEGVYRIRGELNKSPEPYVTLLRKLISGVDTIYLDSVPVDQRSEQGYIINAKKPFPYSQNNATFYYASPSFYRENANLYQTWLEGFDKNWTAWSKDTKKEYHNLHEGSYSFHVRAKNIFNTVSSEAVYNFSVLPPWYRTYWALLLYILVLAALVYLIVYLNGKRLKAANIKLEGIVRERTAEIENQKEEILAQSDHLQELNYELNQQNEEIQAQSDELQMLNTELQERSDRIEKQRDQLKELNATKDRFFSIIAHDLKTPFQSLIGLSDLLSTDYDSLSLEEIKEMNTTINKSAVSGFVLLENLLEWARSQTQNIKYNPQVIDVRELISHNFSILKGPAANKNIELRSEVEEESCVFADYNMVNTVFRNLISNAIKFTPENGRISVSVQKSKTHVSFFVKDNGVGMEKEDIDKLFRLDVKHTTMGTDNEKGTGLGLLLCKDFIGTNKGTIRVESKPGVGSTFIFTLPCHKEE